MTSFALNEMVAGLRIGGATLWAWMLWRVLFESADIHMAPDPVRRAGWVHFRRFIVCMGSSIVFFMAPENILRAGGKISEEASFILMTCGSLLVLVAAILVHHGLDIATERSSKSYGIYIVIALISVLYSIVGGLL